MNFNSLFFVLLFGFFCSVCYGQFEPKQEECNLLTRTVENDVLGTKRVISKNEIRVNDLSSGDLFQVVMTRNEKTFSFIIRGVDRHCFNNDTEVSFHFRNGAAIKFNSQNKDNCESLVLINMGGIYRKEEVYEDFLNQYIVGIMFTSASGEQHRLKIETPQTEMIREVFECLIVAE